MRFRKGSSSPEPPRKSLKVIKYILFIIGALSTTVQNEKVLAIGHGAEREGSRYNAPAGPCLLEVSH